jgi:hypothetical protein
MARYIGFLLTKIHPSEWLNIAWGLTESANQKNSPPLSQAELVATFNSIVVRERRNNSDRWYKKEEIKEQSDIWKDEENKIMLMSQIAGLEENSE